MTVCPPWVVSPAGADAAAGFPLTAVHDSPSSTAIAAHRSTRWPAVTTVSFFQHLNKREAAGSCIARAVARYLTGAAFYDTGSEVSHQYVSERAKATRQAEPAF